MIKRYDETIFSIQLYIFNFLGVYNKCLQNENIVFFHILNTSNFQAQSYTLNFYIPNQIKDFIPVTSIFIIVSLT